MATGGKKYDITKLAVQKNWVFIKQSASFSDIADQMLQQHIIDFNEHKHFNYEINSLNERMDKLLYVILKGDETVLQDFAEALVQTECSFVVEKLEEVSALSVPVTKPEKRVHVQSNQKDTEETGYKITKSGIQSQWTHIKKSLTFSKIADFLLQEGVISVQDHKLFSYDITKEDEKMNKLFYKIFGDKREDLRNFARALELAGYSNIIEMLEKSSALSAPVTKRGKRMYMQDGDHKKDVQHERSEKDGDHKKDVQHERTEKESTDKPPTLKDMETLFEKAFQKQGEHLKTVVTSTVSKQMAALQKELKVRIEKENEEVQELEAKIKHEKTINENVKQALEQKSQECHKLQKENEFMKKQVEAWSNDAISAEKYSQLREKYLLLEQKRKELDSKLKEFTKKDSENRDKIKSLNEDVARTEREIKQLKQNQNAAIEDERLKHMAVIQENERKIKALENKIKKLGIY